MPEILCPLQEAAERMPHAVAITAPHREYTYREYHEYVTGTAANLRKAGIGEGDILAIALPPGTPYPMILMALFRLGAVAFPVNTRFPAQYLLDVLKRVHCRNMVVPYGASVTTLYGHLYALAPHDLVDSPCPSSARYSVATGRPATMVLTSGSTGDPKAALLSYGNHYHNALLSNQNIPVEPGDRWLMSLPSYHVAGLGVLFRCLLGGAAVAFSSSRESLPEAILSSDATHLSLVPTQLWRLLQEAESVDTLRGLKAILLGGGPAPEGLIRRACEAGLPLFISYGLTETATQVATTRPADPLDRLLTSGRPLDPVGVRISSEGEIQVRGDTVFLGYVEGSELRRPLTEDGWFATGDLGVLDEQGYLRVTGRRDNMFIAGGENIQPEEIEAHLQQLENIVEAVVVPVENDEFGTIPAAFVKVKGNGAFNEAVFTRHLAGRLPKYKVPRFFFPWPGEDVTQLDAKLPRHELASKAQRLIR